MILPQSSAYFDSEADPELKKPPDQSEISTRRSLGKICISSGQKIMLSQEMIRRLQLLIRNEISLIRKKMR